MRIETELRTLKRRYPFRIARGTSLATNNVFVKLFDPAQPELLGLGECAPAVGEEALASLCVDALSSFEPATLDPRALHAQGLEAELPMPALCALDTACWDLLAKRARLPLQTLLGFSKPSVATSITVGINPPDVTRERVAELLAENRFRYLKVKLGASEGLDFDRAHFEAARSVAETHNVTVRVDANCGWSLSEALEMIDWLEARGVDYVEQPLARDAHEEYGKLFARRKLPIFVDESCQTAQDIGRWADRCDGINVKLMKCGGITGALRIIETARAHGLKLMIGCMGESSVSISAGAALSAAFDHIDLDSHLKLADDPARGALLTDGVIMPTRTSGHGATLR